MKKWLLILISFCLLPTLAQANDSAYWPNWRGPNANGLVDSGNPPVKWDESTNIRWKVKIPGMGHATPVAWGDRIFVQTAVQTDKTVEVTQKGKKTPPANVYQFKVMALERKTGKVVWEKTVREVNPHEGMHQTASFASSSGVTDGEHLYAFFGSRGLYCFDLDGTLKWDKDFGKQAMAGTFGEGASPTIHGNTLIINLDQQGDSFLITMDKKTGKEIWRKARSERTTWVTPFIIEHKGKTQVIISASKKTRSYDLKTGDVIWECAGLGSNVIPTPVYADGVVYVTSGHRQPAMQAISLDKAQGDITGTDAVLWSIADNTPYVSSPLLYGDNIFVLKNRNAILSCYNAKTGEAFYGPQRLEGMRRAYASLVGVNDRVYISGLGGTTLVIKNSSTYEVLATNSLDEGIAASPVIVDNELYLRGDEHLYCIAEE